MQIRRIEPGLERRVVEGGDRVEVFERDHFCFGPAMLTPGTPGIAGLEDQHRMSLDGDPCLLCHLLSLSVRV